MQNRTLDVKDKDVVVLGLGKSGMAAATLLQRDGARVVVRDEADNQTLAGRASLIKCGRLVPDTNRAFACVSLRDGINCVAGCARSSTG